LVVGEGRIVEPFDVEFGCKTIREEDDVFELFVRGSESLCSLFESRDDFGFAKWRQTRNSALNYIVGGDRSQWNNPFGASAKEFDG
jgi:hypothetical protein